MTTEEDKAKQTAHAERIREERTLSRVTGLPRPAVRSLLEHRERVAQKITERNLRNENKKATPTIRVTDVKTERTPFKAGPAIGGAGDGGAGGAGTISNVIIVFNGTGKYCSLKGTIGANV